MINWRGVIGSAATLLMLGTASADPAKPMDPANAIIEAVKTHDVVALGEGSHGNEQGAAFRMKLYRDPRFRAVVRDIVVECPRVWTTRTRAACAPAVMESVAAMNSMATMIRFLIPLPSSIKRSTGRTMDWVMGLSTGIGWSSRAVAYTRPKGA